MSSKADFYFNKGGKWHNEFAEMRKIALSGGLSEDLKWGCPCYTQDGRNVVLIHGFKEYCAFLFFKGAIMKDPKKLLVRQTPNVQSARQIRFTEATQIAKIAPTLRTYIKEAIRVEKSGQKVAMKKTSSFIVPEEFREQLDRNPALSAAFRSLTPGRQRGYLFFFGSAKQPETRKSRVEKNIPRILKGKGLDD